MLRDLILYPFCLALLSMGTSCNSQPTSDVAQWWYTEQPEGFTDQSIGGGGRPRQVPNSSNTGANAGKR